MFLSFNEFHRQMGKADFFFLNFIFTVGETLFFFLIECFRIPEFQLMQLRLGFSSSLVKFIAKPLLMGETGKKASLLISPWFTELVHVKHFDRRIVFRELCKKLK